MEDGSSRRIAIATRILYGLLLFFAVFFVIGFFNVGGKVLLASLVPFVLLALLLVFVTPAIRPIILRNYLWLTAIGALLFTAGVAYGVLGIWGVFEVDNKIYLGTVLLSWACFLLGLIESFVHLRKRKRRERINGDGD